MTDPITLKPPCAHANIAFDVSAVATPDSNIIGADIAARCADCETMFKWMGIFRTSETDMGRISVSEDGEWLRLPMVAAGEIPRRPRILDKAEGAA